MLQQGPLWRFALPLALLYNSNGSQSIGVECNWESWTVLAAERDTVAHAVVTFHFGPCSYAMQCYATLQCSVPF